MPRKTRPDWLPWWQGLFIFLSCTWLFAPGSNRMLSHKTAYISQFESTMQPFSGWFRTGDILAALLLMAVAILIFRRAHRHIVSIILGIIGLGMFLDAAFTASCQAAVQDCDTFARLSTHIHNYESMVTFWATSTLIVYDAIKRRGAYSISMAAAQAFIAVYSLHQFAPFSHYNTLVQFAYFSSAAVWIAWYVRELLQKPSLSNAAKGWYAVVRKATAVWVFANGVLILLLSLTRVRFFSEINESFQGYLPYGTWIAQHSIIIGILLLYLSRHLLRGELRARQIVLALLGLEIIKFAVITPNATILSTLIAGFLVIFVSREAFRLGTIPVVLAVRKKDALYIGLGLAMAALLSLAILGSHQRSVETFRRTTANYTALIRNETAPHDRDFAGVLLARSLTVFGLMGVAAVAWALFRPIRTSRQESDDRHKVLDTLKGYSHHSEDYFKYWPADKLYYWNDTHTAFVAYKMVASTVFVLADPIGEDKQTILDNFTRYCQARRLKVCCLPVYKQSLQLYQQSGYNTIAIGSSAVIDTGSFAATTFKNKWWRWQKNRATKQGYVYAISHPPHADTFLRQLRSISDQWLQTGNHQEQSFAMGYFDESYMDVCEVHYLVDANGEVVAFANEIPQFSRNETTTVDLIRFAPGSENSMPFLLYSIILELAQNGSARHFDLGFVPFAKVEGPLIRITQTLAGKRFSSKGLEQFKNKFEPVWETNYFAYQGDLADLGTIASRLDKAMSDPFTKKERRAQK